jgi:hypothetical protein
VWVFLFVHYRPLYGAFLASYIYTRAQALEVIRSINMPITTTSPPTRGIVYCLSDIYKTLDLLDIPALTFTYKDRKGIVQTSHTTTEQLLSVPGFADSKWIYTRTTSEWIPLFEYFDQIPIIKFVDVVKWHDGSLFVDRWWATPKGFPRDHQKR